MATEAAKGGGARSSMVSSIGVVDVVEPAEAASVEWLKTEASEMFLEVIVSEGGLLTVLMPGRRKGVRVCRRGVRRGVGG